MAENVNETMDKLTSMWRDLQTTERIPKTNSIPLTSCETELQELMKQIDIMVHNKYMDWERDMSLLQAKVDLREKEAVMQKATLKQKHTEIGQLRQQIEGMDKAQREMATQYEAQLTQLKNQLLGLKRDYEKLQKKNSKHSKVLEREKDRQHAEVQATTLEVDRLNTKIQEYKNKFQEWEMEKLTYQKHIESVESQKKAFSEKYELLQHQAAGLKSQLECRREIINSTEMNLKSHLAHAEGHLERARDTVNHQVSKIKSLKSALEESTQGYKRMIDDNGALQGQLHQSRLTIRNLEDRIIDLTSQIQSRDEQLQNANVEQKQYSEEMNRLEMSMINKDDSLRSLTDKEIETESQITQLNQTVQTLKVQNKVCKKNEKNLHDDVMRLHNQLDASHQECAMLNQEYRKKIGEVRVLEGTDIKRLNEEIKELQGKMAIANETHHGELEGMRKELSAVTTDLHQRNITVASLSGNMANMERHRRDSTDNLQKLTSELQVANAQLEALRLENKHMRKTLLKLGDNTKDVDIAETENHLRELQYAYTLSLAKLEDDNKKLRSDLDNLHEEIQEIQHYSQENNKSLVQETHKAINDIRQSEQQQITSIRQDFERRNKNIQDRLEATVSKYEDEVHEIRTENSELRKDLDMKTKFIQRLTGELEVMGGFIDSVDPVVKTPARRHTANTSGVGSVHTEMLNSFHPLLHSSTSNSEDDRVSISAQFYAEEQERKKQLEKILDSRIEDLKSQTEETIKKYS